MRSRIKTRKGKGKGNSTPTDLLASGAMHPKRKLEEMQREEGCRRETGREEEEEEDGICLAGFVSGPDSCITCAVFVIYGGIR